MNSIDEVLAKRGQKYGEYRDLAAMLDKILGIYEQSENWAFLEPFMRVSLMMDAMKTVRILNGDWNEIDSWTDKQGYIQLVIREIEGAKHDEQSASEHSGTDRKA